MRVFIGCKQLLNLLSDEETQFATKIKVELTIIYSHIPLSALSFYQYISFILYLH